jgi:hypothetical protein
MRHDVDSALAFYSLNNSSVAEVDEETDLIGDEELELCPDCGTELIDFEDDPFALHCPACDTRYR